MSRKIPDATKTLMGELYALGLPIAETARRTNVPYSTAYNYTRLRQRFNPETGQRFESRTEYDAHLARQRLNPETGRRFESGAEYKAYRVRQRLNPETGLPFESGAEYKAYRVRQRFNPETGRRFESGAEYDAHLARQRLNPETGLPFESRTEYDAHLARQRQNRRENQELGNLIQQRLTELRQTQKWLAEKLEITEGAVSRYISGKTTPRKSLQERLFNALGLPYKTLDDLLEISEFSISL